MPTRAKSFVSSERGRATAPSTRPITMQTSTGTPTEPKAPSGSRMNTLISIHVSHNRPRSIISIANGVTGKGEKHVLERWQHRSKVGDADPVRRDAVDHVRHQILAAALN